MPEGQLRCTVRHTSLRQHFICRRATSFCVRKRNDVDLRSNDVCNCVAKRCCVLRTQTQKIRASLSTCSYFLEATIGFEPMNQGVADPRLTTWLCRHIIGADDEARTRYLHLGKVALYQMSYIRIKNE